jgi:hypothetical protein
MVICSVISAPAPPATSYTTNDGIVVDVNRTVPRVNFHLSIMKPASMSPNIKTAVTS